MGRKKEHVKKPYSPSWLLILLGILIAQPSLAQEPPRKFHMGFAYQPHDWNDAAFAYAFQKVDEFGDMIGIFFDSFIPWQEAYDNSTYHAVQEAEIKKRLNGIRPGQKVLLGLSILGMDRVSLSGNLGETEGPRTGIWADKTFNDPQVIKAYLNYCARMIRLFNPDYLVYVMEVDAGLTSLKDPRFQNLLAAIKQLYPALKKAHPNLPILLEFMLENDEEMKKRAAVVHALLPYSDMYAVSSYPFLMTGGDAADIPRNWFARVKTIAPGKPFAIVEGNHLAENFYHPTMGIRLPGKKKRLLIPGTEAWQADYIAFLLEQAQSLDAEFVLQWNIRDLDQLMTLLAGGGSDWDPKIEPFLGLATDCGLIDENGRARPSLGIWRRWLDRPKSK